MRKQIRKLTAIILAVMIALAGFPMWIFATGSDAGIDYDGAANGEVLYRVNFNGDDVYQPFNFRNGNADMANSEVTVIDGGAGLFARVPQTTSAAWFYGGPIKGLTLGADKQYTFTFKMSFPSGRAGFYFNFGYSTPEDDPLVTRDYNGLYGFYGRLIDTNATLSRAAGGKLTGDTVSSSSKYTALPSAAKIANDVLADVKIEIDGFFYSVWFKKTTSDEWVLYDHVNMLDTDKCPNFPCENLGFTVYLYNKGSTTTVRDVVITKGVEHTAASYGSQSLISAPDCGNTSINYDAFSDGDKLADLTFNAESGAYVFDDLAGNPENHTLTVDENGKKVTISIGADSTAAAVWYGDRIGKLKISDDTKYTFKYKVRTQITGENRVYVGGIAFNASPYGIAANRTGNRLNWYGLFTPCGDFSFNYNGQSYATAVKYETNANVIDGYDYTSYPMESFYTFVPALDSDGYADVMVTLDGWTWTYYAKDSGGNYYALQTVDNKEIIKKQAGYGEVISYCDDLAFITYTYNLGAEFSIKDAELYKGIIGDNVHVHSFGEWSEDRHISCTASGRIKRTCDECGMDEKKEINAPGHRYVNNVCTVCGASDKEFTAITTAEQFAGMNAAGCYYLESDISITASYASEFTGVLDGNGHTVTTTVPLFATLSGTVKNLVIDAAVPGTGIVVTGDEVIAGALATLASGSVSVKNVVNNVNVTSDYRAGGIIGQISSGSNVEIIDSVNNGAISITDANSTGSGIMVGGIVGYQQSNTLYIRNSVNNGTVNAALGLAGGIIGRAGADNIKANEWHCIIDNCLNTGSVTANTQTGGIIGYARSVTLTVNRCTNRGSVLSVTSAAGGILGYSSYYKNKTISGVTYSNAGNSNIFIRRCFNEGNVTAETNSTDAGGITTYIYCTGGSKSATGSVKNHIIVEECVNRGVITGAGDKSYVSQIAAYANSNDNIIRGNIGLGSVVKTSGAPKLSYFSFSSANVTDLFSGNIVVANDGTQYAYYGNSPNQVLLGAADAQVRVVSAAEAEAAVLALGGVGFDDRKPAESGEWLDVEFETSFTMTDAFSLNYYVDANVLAGYTGIRLVVEKEQFDFSGNRIENKTAELTGTTVSGRIKFTYTGIASYEIGDELSAVLYAEKDGMTYETPVYVTSLRENIENTFLRTSDPKLITLIADILNYGTASQIYFGYRPGNPVNSNYGISYVGSSSHDRLESVGDTEPLDGNVSAVFYGKSIVFASTAELKVYFRLTDEFDGNTEYLKVRFVYNDEIREIPFDAMTFREDYGAYAAKLTGLPIYEARTPIKITVLENNTAISDTITYSLESYARNRLEATNSVEFSALLEAMMKYSDSARNYIAQ